MEGEVVFPSPTDKTGCLFASCRQLAFSVKQIRQDSEAMFNLKTSNLNVRTIQNNVHSSDYDDAAVKSWQKSKLPGVVRNAA